MSRGDHLESNQIVVTGYLVCMVTVKFTDKNLSNDSIEGEWTSLCKIGVRIDTRIITLNLS